MKKNKNLIFGFSLGFIVILNYLIFNIALKKEVDLIKIPVVKETIYPRSKISEKDIMYIEVPSIFVSDNFYVKKEDIINKYTDIRAMMPKSSLFYKELLFEEKMLPDYPAILLNDNQVAYNMATDLIKLSGNSIVVGQKVDIYSTYHKRNEKPIVDLLIKSVRVIGVKDKKGLDVSNPNSNGMPHIVLLALNKEQMPIVRSVDEIAKVELVAYSAKDQIIEESILNSDALILNYISYE